MTETTSTQEEKNETAAILRRTVNIIEARHNPTPRKLFESLIFEGQDTPSKTELGFTGWINDFIATLSPEAVENYRKHDSDHGIDFLMNCVEAFFLIGYLHGLRAAGVKPDEIAQGLAGWIRPLKHEEDFDN